MQSCSRGREDVPGLRHLWRVREKEAEGLKLLLTKGGSSQQQQVRPSDLFCIMSCEASCGCVSPAFSGNLAFSRIVHKRAFKNKPF